MRWKPAVGKPIIWTLLVMTIFQKVSSSGDFELSLSSFSNIHNLNAVGECCSGTRTNGKCTSPCRTFFRICLKHYQSKITPDPPCTYGEEITPVLDTSNPSNSSIKNPIKLPFTFSWRGDFSLIIEAWHDRTSNGPSSKSPRDLILRIATQTQSRAGSTWTKSSTNRTNHAQLTYEFRVVCSKNYYGDTCSKLCIPREDKFGHFNCDKNGTKVCRDGWQGPYCDTAVCLPGCDEPRGYCKKPSECQCRSGWQGEMCEKCIVYPGCLHGTCHKPWECNCDEGWGGEFCDLDLNYCTHHNPCSNGATCRNTGQGSYTCSCRPGFSGKNCETLNDEDKDDCKPDPCLNGGSCVDIGRTYQCLCMSGFHGRNCESNSTSCATNPCKYGGTCLERHGSYICECTSGYTGVDCEMEKDECISSPCLNGGRCVDEIDGFRCICPVGYIGEHCESNQDDCTTRPCKNNGTCVDLLNDFQCVCKLGFTGKTCDVNINECSNKPCKNGGTCQDLVNDYMCQCVEGYTGKNCTKDVDDCRGSPCQNGGTCIDRHLGYDCDCKIGFQGPNCESASIANSYMRHSDQQRSTAASSMQIVIIICLGAGIPILLIIIVVIILLCRRRTNTMTDDEDTAKRENEQNQAKSMNNKCIDTDIMHTIPPSGKCLKVTNEMHDAKTLNSMEFIIEKPSNNKHLIRNDLQTIDEQVQNKEKQRLQNGSESHESISTLNLARDYSQHYRSPSPSSIDLDTTSIGESQYPSQLRITSKPVNRASPTHSTTVYSIHKHHPYQDVILATEV